MRYLKAHWQYVVIGLAIAYFLFHKKGLAAGTGPGGELPNRPGPYGITFMGA